VNKKKQKNFDLMKPLALTMTNPAGIKSFLLLFFQKRSPFSRVQTASG
jgi:hypothetical protein